jgi:muramidase (phage lysozyme)
VTSKSKKSANSCPLANNVLENDTEPSSGIWWYLITCSALVLIAMMVGGLRGVPWKQMVPFNEPPESSAPVPLVMRGGDPYIRAMMRTISASESSGSRPYSLLYGGEHVATLSSHPDRCVRIVTGPNLNNCTTAAGRYQMLTSTWLDKAQEYHPNPPFFPWESYSFSPEYQDEVTYRWLSDSKAWGVNLSQLLREGRVKEVLHILSPTWTSLGYGIETNSVSDDLPHIYEQMLQEEL